MCPMVVEPLPIGDRRAGMRRRRTFVIVSLLALLSACGGHATATPISQPVTITTAPAAANGCIDAPIGGRLVVDSRWGVALEDPSGGSRVGAVFPFGYRGVLNQGQIGVFDGAGNLVAATGQSIESGGGYVGEGANQRAILCDGSIKV